MNIILCGFMGSGKTVVGKELAKIMGKKFVDTDDLIEKETGIAIKAIFEVHGEEYFRVLESKTCKKVGEMNNCVVATGGGALVNEENVRSVKENGSVVFLDASFDVICQRIGNTNTRPLFKDREKAKTLYDRRKEKYAAAADYVINGDLSARKTALCVAGLFK